MNYALDALWWELKQPQVRDLASLLVAPSPWVSGYELPVRELLGPEGFRYLLSLDQKPEPLLNYLQENPPGCRLGIYAERLLSFWLSHAPHTELLAYNLNIQENGRTLGALDFLARISGTVYHLELTCKYYGGFLLAIENMVGLNETDFLGNKIDKIQRQLRLSKHQEITNWCHTRQITPPKAASIIRGNLFIPALDNHLDAPQPLNPYGWYGTLVFNLESLSSFSEQKFAILSPDRLLAPARVSSEETLTFNELSHKPQIIAILEQRIDHHYHETARFMLPATAET